MNYMSVQRIKNARGFDLAYVLSEGKESSLPMVVFMGGFRSDMAGTKALYLERICRERGQSFLRFDYTGHGISGGKFEEGTIGDWTDDALCMLDHVAKGPLILVGSSMGGWISLLCAQARPDRVKGLVGLAAAPDFTKDIYENRFTDSMRETMDRQGYVEIPNDYSDEPYYISKALIEDGKEHCLLHKAIPITVPVRLIQGMADHDVPWRTALQIRDFLESRDVGIYMIEDAGHSLSRDEDLDVLGSLLSSLSAEQKSVLSGFHSVSIKL